MGKVFPDHTHKYGNKMTVITLETYCQTLGGDKQTKGYLNDPNKSAKEILGNILSSELKMQRYIQILTEQAISIKQK